MKIAIAQINPIIADIEGNKIKIIDYIEKAKAKDVELLVFPEMTTIGYPPMDLLENPKLVDDNIESLNEIKKHTKDIGVICGYVDFDPDNKNLLYNSAALLYNGELIFTQDKTLLPAYDVFDELRYFNKADSNDLITFKDKKIGITICEDVWNPLNLENRKFTEKKKYEIDPVKTLTKKGAEIIVNLSASPYVKEKNRYKREMLSKIASSNNISLIYANQIGGNDSLIFDGNSLIINNKGQITSKGKSFCEDLIIGDTMSDNEIKFDDNELEDIKLALELGIKDYLKKCGFKKVVIGLSGGIDSALTATLAKNAIGAENVFGVTMPSMYSSEGSVNDSKDLASNLEIEIETIAIKPLYEEFINNLSPIFSGLPLDITEENIQARIRGNLLMAISNKTNAMVLTTGNKSELAMGYCTLYGDMSGGLAVISDLPKTLVYELSRHINKDKEIIPWNTIEKAPSAELRPDQKDEDSLPPYEILDKILDLYIEDLKSTEEIIEKGFNQETVKWILKMVNINEYKRRQAAPGLKITTKAFGTGRRIPLAMKFVP